MPQPTGSALHINAPLTNVSVAYTINEQAYIADKVFPEIPVDHKSDSYWTIPKGAWFRDEARPRPGGTESVGSGYDVGTDTFNTIVEAIHKDVDRNLTSLRRSRRPVTNFVASAPTGNQFIQWSDLDDSNPRADVKRWRRQILSTTGYKPNTLVLGYDVMDVLADHPQFIDRIKYTDPESVDVATLARIFGVERVFVSEAVVNSGKEGNADNFGFMLGKVVWLGYVAPAPGLLVPSAGYNFAWKGVSGGLGQTVGIKKFRMEHLASDRVEGEIAVDSKVVAADLAIFASNVVV